MQRKFCVAFHTPGAMAANGNIRFTVPSDCTLRHVSAVGSNAHNATLTIGDSTDTDGYIAAYTVGVSNTPVQKEALTDFDGALASNQYPDIADGAIVVLVIDYDGAGGTAIEDMTIVLTFVEG